MSNNVKFYGMWLGGVILMTLWRLAAMGWLVGG